MKKDFDGEFTREMELAEKQRPKRVDFFREQLLPTFIPEWPQGLHDLSVWSTFSAFPSKLLLETYNDGDDGSRAFVADLSRRVEQMRARHGGDAFFRLGSQSPKDAWYGHTLLVSGDRGCSQPPRASSFAIADAFARSMRVLDDCIQAQDVGYEPVLCARSFVEGIEPHREFRCFMDDRELAGISVYRAWDDLPKPEIVADPSRWENAIRNWFPTFAAASHPASVIFDVVVLDDRVVLLELNPWLSTTYPGHFEGKALDGTFRFLGDGRASLQTR